MIKKLLILLLLFVSIENFAQEAKFLREAEQLYQQKKYETLIRLLENNSRAIKYLTIDDLVIFWVYLSQGYLNVDEPILAERALLYRKKLTEQLYGKNHISYIHTIYDMGRFYFAQRRYAEAVQYLEETENNPNPLTAEQYASLLYSLAVSYDVLGELTVSDEFYSEAFKIYRDVLTENDSNYLRFVVDYATFCDKTFQNQKAKDLFEKAKELALKQPKDYPSTAYIANRVAQYYFNQGFYTKADDFFNMSYELTMKDSIYSYARMTEFFALAQYYNWNKDYSKARTLALLLNDYYKPQMEKNALLLSEASRESFWISIEPVFSIIFSIARNCPTDSVLADICYNNQLVNKANLLYSVLKMKDIVQKSGNIELKNLYQTIRQTEQEFVQLSDSIALQETYQKFVESYSDFNQKLQPYLSSQKEDIVSWQDIQKQLKPDEAAIEFVCFNELDANGKNNFVYMALLIQKDWNCPKIVPLCEENELLRTMSKYSFKNLKSVGALYNSNELYNLLWEPVKKHLSDNVKNVYYSTSSFLDILSFQNISKAGKNRLYESYTNMYRLSSTRELVQGSLNNVLDAQQAVIFGQINYDSDKNYTNSQSKSTVCREPFDTIEDKNEINAIVNICNNTGLSYATYLGNEATEEVLKSLNGRTVSLLHISAHGAYIHLDDFEKCPWLNQNKEIQEDYPMQRSLLAFAGANKYWLTGDKPANTMNDGILSAQEISKLDFSGLDLVVLSACQSALGDINSNEGILGLARAFKLAGAKTLILSLWDVPQQATGIFMSHFYKALLTDKKGKHDAFKYAQKQMQDSDYSIEDWGGFIMID
ncbi:MAG: CHAT domain-containing protein [Prevotellaceae bacterium]|jgi:CHAT domain-containing protein|nr:CHAT domain-containing protein [Prevotellaceae bacterium]